MYVSNVWLTTHAIRDMCFAHRIPYQLIINDVRSETQHSVCADRIIGEPYLLGQICDSAGPPIHGLHRRLAA
jgi:hypothetical protein